MGFTPTALRISEVAGLRVGGVNPDGGLLRTDPGRGGLVTKETKGRRRTSPIIEPRREPLGG